MSTQYKVVKIVDEYTIIINAGSQNSIRIGDKFEIYVIGEEVIDPDTNETLGTLDNIKATVEVITLLPKMCVCKDIAVEITSTNIFSALQPKTFKKDVPTRLKVDSAQISGGLDKDLTIVVGDLARKVQS